MRNVQIIGRNFSSTTGTVSGASYLAEIEQVGVFQVDAGRIGLVDRVRSFTANTWSIAVGTPSANLVCFERETLRNARLYGRELLKWAEVHGFAAVVLPGGAAPEEKIDVRRRLLGSVRAILDGFEGTTELYIQNGRGTSLANIAHVIDVVDDPRLGVSLHLGEAFAAGYEVYDLLNLNVQRVGVVQLALPSASTTCGKQPFKLGGLCASAWDLYEVEALAAAHQHSPLVLNSKVASRDFSTLRALLAGDSVGNAVAVDQDVSTSDRDR